MRRLLIPSALLFLSCSSLWAADRSDHRWRVSILASEISTTPAGVWSRDAHAGLGIGVAYAPAPRWDIELTAASQSHRSPYRRVFYVADAMPGPGQILSVTEFREYDVKPLDLSVTRHFRTEQRVAPYIRAGVRHVSAPDGQVTPVFFNPGSFPVGQPIQVSEGFAFTPDRTSTQAGGGIRVRLTPRTGIRAEVNRLLRSEGVEFDPLTRYAIGVSYAF